MDLDTLNNIYLTGLFEGSGDFDPNAGTSILSSNGILEVFVLKFNQTIGLPVLPLQQSLHISYYPNPTAEILYVDKGNNEQLHLRIIDNLGRQLVSKKTKEQTTSIRLNNWKAGMYYLVVDNDKQVVTKKIIKK